jgi:hypothetical protein
MKLFKRKFEFKLFGIRISGMVSNYKYGYKKKKVRPDAEQITFIEVENIDTNRT